jgi:hypothetical protein
VTLALHSAGTVADKHNITILISTINCDSAAFIYPWSPGEDAVGIVFTNKITAYSGDTTFRNSDEVVMYCMMA